MEEEEDEEVEASTEASWSTKLSLISEPSMEEPSMDISQFSEDGAINTQQLSDKSEERVRR